MKKNVAGQKVGVQMVTASDGSAFTGSVTVSVTGDAGTQATGSVGSGACTHEGNGYHTYAPAQAETNYDLVAFTFTGTGAVPQTVQIYTLAENIPANVTQFGGTNGTFSGGRPEVNTTHLAGSSTTLSQVISSLITYAGTASSGTTTTLVDAGLTQGNDYWNDSWVLFTSGNNIGQCRQITDFDAATDTITFSPAVANAVTTHSYIIIPAARLNVVLAANVAHGGGTATFTLEDLTITGELAADTIAVASGAFMAITGNITGNLSGSVGSVTGAVGSVTGNVGGNVTGSVGSVLGGINTTGGTITTLDALDTAQDAKHDATKADTAAILLDTGTDGVVVAAGSKTGYSLAATHDLYHADINFAVDEANTRDEYTVTWFKNGVRQTSVTGGQIQVVKRADGTDLIAAATNMTQIGSTGSWKYDGETTERTTAGEAVIVIVTATIDAGTRTFSRVVSRDSEAAP